jgi:hypothetical protein
VYRVVGQVHQHEGQYGPVRVLKLEIGISVSCHGYNHNDLCHRHSIRMDKDSSPQGVKSLRESALDGVPDL